MNEYLRFEINWKKDQVNAVISNLNCRNNCYLPAGGLNLQMNKNILIYHRNVTYKCKQGRTGGH